MMTKFVIGERSFITKIAVINNPDRGVIVPLRRSFDAELFNKLHIYVELDWTFKINLERYTKTVSVTI